MIDLDNVRTMAQKHGLSKEETEELVKTVKQNQERFEETIKAVEAPRQQIRLTIWIKRSGYITKITTPEEVERVKRYIQGRPDLSGLTIFADKAEWIIPHDSISHISIASSQQDVSRGRE